MSDWAKQGKARGIKVTKVMLKQEKLLLLARTLRLPQFDCLVLPYRNFNLQNLELVKFYQEHLAKGEGFCVRALPTIEGLEKGFTRKPTLGFLDFEQSKSFLESIIKDNTNFYDVGLTNWIPQDYGLAIAAGIENGRLILGEIARDLQKLTAGKENPLASVCIDRGGLGHLEDKTFWKLGDKNTLEGGFLWSAINNYVLAGKDRFDLSFWPGYYEAVVTKKGKIKFVDYDPEFRI